MKKILLVFAFSAGTAGFLFGADSWKIPTPDSNPHPAAKDASASSPLTYPDPEGFKKRADLIIQGLAMNEMQGWRRGFFTSNDPGKYTFGPAMAKLILDPKAADVLELMNDNRTPTEHYHFAAVNWARFYPIFKESLTEKTQKAVAENAARFPYFGAPGTENHRSMGMTSGSVLPSYFEGGRLSNMDRKAALERGKNELRAYVKGIYKAGLGEWDSSTYLIFSINGMLNVYDFAEDEETRLIAGAALDWMVAAYALKYRDGVYTAPNQRGFAKYSMYKLTDQDGWLWWGSNREITDYDAKGFLYTMHAITSSWRPNLVLCHLARKELPVLPFMARDSKGNYWYGQQQPPDPGHYQETVYVAKNFTMGSLLNGFGSQITPFQIAAQTPEGTVVFTGGNPRKSDENGKILDELSYEDGNGRYDQSGQAGASLINLSNIPEDEKAAFSFFSVPEKAGEPLRHNKWWVMQVGRTYVAVQGIGAEGILVEPELDKKQREEREKNLAKGKVWEGVSRILRFDGRQTGFVVQAADETQFGDRDLFMKALDGTLVAAENSPTQFRVTYKNLAGEELAVQFQSGKSSARVTVNGRVPDFNPKAVYDSPYLQQKDGILTINDGKEGYRIDFTGNLPVYRPWKSAP